MGEWVTSKMKKDMLSHVPGIIFKSKLLYLLLFEL